MYLPAHFAESRPEVLRALVAAHPFALLATQAVDGELVADGLPFFLDTGPDDGPFGVLRAHVARANPLWHRSRTDVDSLVVFQGPHA